MIVTELMSNFELISHATILLDNPSFHPKITHLINQILSSKRRAIPKLIIPDTDIRLARGASTKHSHVSTYLELTYGKDQYTYYSMCFFKDVPFKARSTSNSQVDDSAVIYSDEFDNFHLGMIAGIIRLKATGDILFVIDEASFNGHDSFLLNGNKYINELFIYATLPTPPNTISIRYNSIKEKIAYRLYGNLNSLCEFHIFPNLLEST